jgi:tetratricopeptide (TPR) repeat protein
MLRYFYALLVLSFMGSIAYYFHQKATSLFADKQIIDAVHTPHLNPLFENADKAKYNQDYPKAAIEFEQLLKTKLTTADSQYIFNQLAFIHLNLNEDAVAYQWISQFERTLPPLSINVESDYNYNVGTWASHTFKPKMANEYLQRALVLYKKIYGEKHVKTALCLTQLGLMHYQFGKNFMDSTKHYLSLADTIFQSNTSPQIASFSALCVEFATDFVAAFCVVTV